ncbi:hypothetical protein [Pseudothauera rhizosphaerae]|uniref:DUF3325 domain-containing protein n=1 Tax=Pseudothauera rhizosphaerae TaxID=2565932 RepID=A0A4S4AYA6_9RHOO|nr:hypothetical protein [Pseudothauera rhizosphaerae]THF65105.1 hypothetical protein E6O51_00410 [Pseudothauera rhizosphaerae]
MNASFTLGLLLAAAGCLCIYLASPNQCWRAAAWPARPARAAGALLLASGLAALLQTLQAPAASFVFACWLMLLLVFFPYLGAWRSSRKAQP